MWKNIAAGLIHIAKILELKVFTKFWKTLADNNLISW